MREMVCDKRRELEKALIAALEAVYATAGSEREAARDVEREASKALDDHIKEHDCRMFQNPGFHSRAASA